MTGRLLPRDEWPSLMGTELETVWPHLPDAAQVWAVESKGSIVGCWALFPVWHAEGVWIEPTHRGKGRVALQLLHGLDAMASAVGVKHVATAALDEGVASLIRHAGGTALQGQWFTLPTGETSCQPL